MILPFSHCGLGYLRSYLFLCCKEGLSNCIVILLRTYIGHFSCTLPKIECGENPSVSVIGTLDASLMSLSISHPCYWFAICWQFTLAQLILLHRLLSPWRWGCSHSLHLLGEKALLDIILDSKVSPMVYMFLRVLVAEESLSLNILSRQYIST